VRLTRILLFSTAVDPAPLLVLAGYSETGYFETGYFETGYFETGYFETGYFDTENTDHQQPTESPSHQVTKSESLNH